MGFLRRLFGGSAREEPQPASPDVPHAAISPDGLSITVGFGPPGSASPTGREGNELCVVAVGRVSIPASIYRGYQRDVQDWSSGIRLEDPRTGRMMIRDDDYPADFRAAGARSVAAVGIPHHPDAQRDEFAVGHRVRLVPEPTNPVNPNAIAVRSADGRYLGGYIPDDELDGMHGAVPAPVEGLVVWEHSTWRPRVRIGMKLLVGPSVALRLIPELEAAAELARRETRYQRGQEDERAEQEAMRPVLLAAREEQERAKKEAARAAAAAKAEQAALMRRAAKAERAAQSEAWRSQGLCVECGAPIESPAGARGRPTVRCAVHASAARQKRTPTGG